MAAWHEPPRNREPLGVLAVSFVLCVTAMIFGGYELWTFLGKVMKGLGLA